MTKTLLLLAIGIVGTVALRILLILSLRYLYSWFLLTSEKQAQLARPVFALYWLSCAAINSFLLFHQKWLLWVGISAGVSIIPAFFFIWYKAKQNPGSLSDWVEGLYQDAGRPAPDGLIEKLRSAKKAEIPAEGVVIEKSLPDPMELSTEEQALKFAKQIPDHAENHRRLARETFGLELNYEAESIALLDQMIQRGWPDPPAILEAVVTGFGSYLGETIRHIHGGAWCYSQERGLHFEIAGVGLKIFPFAKVKKRLLNGQKDSLEFFYEFIRSKIADADAKNRC